MATVDSSKKTEAEFVVSVAIKKTAATLLEKF